MYSVCRECDVIIHVAEDYCHLCKPYMKEEEVSHYRKIVVGNKEFEWCVNHSGATIRTEDGNINVTEDQFEAITEWDQAKTYHSIDTNPPIERLVIKPGYIREYIELFIL